MARTVKCPSCGAELTVKDDNRDFMFCEYCGTKVDMIDSRIEHHIVDEARIIEAETDRQVKIKHLEMETEEYERKKAKRERAAKKKAQERQDEKRMQEINQSMVKICILILLPFIISAFVGLLGALFS